MLGAPRVRHAAHPFTTPSGDLHDRRRPPDPPGAPRRRFLKSAAAAVGAAGAMAAPMVSQRADDVSFRFQSTWPAKDIFHEYANDFAKKVNDMAGGRLKIEVLPSGAVVPAFQLLEAVNKGTLDGGHGVVAYHYGKNSALALWGSGPAFGMDPNMVLAWHNYGGGKALLEEIYKAINMDVVSFLYGPMPTQPLGWFKKPVAKAEDMKGLKFRTVGLAVDMFTEHGRGGEPAARRRDRAGARPRPDRRGRVQQRVERPRAGLPRRGQELHAAELPPERRAVRDPVQQGASTTRCRPELKAIIDYAVQAASADMSWKAIDRNSQGLHRAEEGRRQVLQDARRDPARAARRRGTRSIAKKPAENPLFKKVLDSQKAFAERAGQWQNDYMVDFKMAYNHYFGQGPKKA